MNIKTQLYTHKLKGGREENKVRNIKGEKLRMENGEEREIKKDEKIKK